MVWGAGWVGFMLFWRSFAFAECRYFVCRCFEYDLVLATKRVESLVNILFR